MSKHTHDLPNSAEDPSRLSHGGEEVASPQPVQPIAVRAVAKHVEPAHEFAEQAILGQIAAAFWFVFILLNYNSACQATRHLLAQEIYKSQLLGTSIEFNIPGIGLIDQRAAILAAAMVLGITILALFFKRCISKEQWIGAGFLGLLFAFIMALEVYGAYHFNLGTAEAQNVFSAQMNAGIAGVMVFMEGLTAYFAYQWILNLQIQRIEEKALAERPKRRSYHADDTSQHATGRYAGRSSETIAWEVGNSNGSRHEDFLRDLFDESQEIITKFEQLQQEVGHVCSARLPQGLVPLSEIKDRTLSSLKQILDSVPYAKYKESVDDAEVLKKILPFPASELATPELWNSYAQKINTEISGLQVQLKGIRSLRQDADEGMRILLNRLQSHQRSGMSRGWDAWRAKGEQKLIQALQERLGSLEAARQEMLSVTATKVKQSIPNETDFDDSRERLDSELKRLKKLPVDELRDLLRVSSSPVSGSELHPAEMHDGRPLNQQDITHAKTSLGIELDKAERNLEAVIQHLTREMRAAGQTALRIQHPELYKANNVNSTSLAGKPAGNIARTDTNAALPTSPEHLALIDKARKHRAIEEKQQKHKERIMWYRYLKAYRAEEEKLLRALEGVERVFASNNLRTRLGFYSILLRMNRVPLPLQVFRIEQEEMEQRKKEKADSEPAKRQVESQKNGTDVLGGGSTPPRGEKKGVQGKLPSDQDGH